MGLEVEFQGGGKGEEGDGEKEGEEGEEGSHLCGWVVPN